MHDDHRTNAPALPADRRPYRPPVGIPRPPGENRRFGTVVSVAIHALVLLLLLAPIATSAVVEVVTGGAGGAGPVGGGGGGTGGTGGRVERVIERLRYLHVGPPAPAEAETPAEPMVPPVDEAPEEPVQPPPTPTAVEPESPVAPRLDVAAILGAGGGTGSDGSAGTGPGTGGGVGSGVGTGRGSGTGPGTGGGDGSVYPPSPIELIIPPFPIPSRIKGTVVDAVFDVDDTGRVLSVTFNPTRDRGYNEQLRERLQRYRFRPAVRPDGTPVRARVSIPITLS